MAHRLAWELAFGPIPDGLLALHRCDNRGCVRPTHLFLGTHDDNNKDRAAKGRSWRPKGSLHPGAKLGPEQVAEIKAVYAAGHVTQDELGRRFGVCQTQISRIVRGTRW